MRGVGCQERNAECKAQGAIYNRRRRQMIIKLIDCLVNQ